MTMFQYTAKVGRKETKGQFYAINQEAAQQYINTHHVVDYAMNGKKFTLLTLSPLNSEQEAQVKTGVAFSL